MRSALIEWDRMDHPELRIVSDELFAQVQEQFARATKGLGVNVTLSTPGAGRPARNMASIETEMREHEAPGLDTEAILAAAFCKYQEHGFSDLWTGASRAAQDYEYRDGFGGLRLVMAIFEPLPNFALHP